MSAPINRQPAGTSTGGQFAPTVHAESDVELTSTDLADSDYTQRGYLDDETCPYCGGEMTWCDTCVQWSRTCCESWGTCMCS